MFSDLGWQRFGQKERHPNAKNRIGIASRMCKAGTYLSGYIRVKWDNTKTFQYYLPDELKFFNVDESVFKSFKQN